MKIIRHLAKDSVIYGGADFFTKIINFIAFPIVATVLSPKAFGALELIFTITALLGLVMNCGLNNSVQRFYWDKDTIPEIRPAIVTSGLYTQIAFGFAAITVGLILTPFALPIMLADEWPLTWVALIAALMVMALSQWSQYMLDIIRLHFAPWHFFVLSLISRVATVSLGLVAVVLLGLGIDGLLSAQALVLILVIPLALWMIRKDIRADSFDWAWVKELVSFGHPFIYVGMAYWLFGSLDRWMLASMASVEEVGIYSVAFRLASIVLFASIAFGQAWSPIAIKTRTDYPEEYRTIYGQVFLLLLFVMMIVGGVVALFSGEIISLIMPAEYLPSALPLAILCFGIILQATLQVTAIGISLEKKTYLFARLAWMAAVVNFIGNWLLIPSFGAVGAAWATLISYMVLAVSYMFYTQRLHPLLIQWKHLTILVGLGVIVASVSFAMIANSFEWFAIIIKLMLAAVCLAVSWLLLSLHSFKSK